MKYLKYCFFLGILILTNCEQNESKKKPALNEKNAIINEDAGVLFKRNTLLVADLKRSLKVYKDILGYSFSGEISTLDDSSYAYAMFNIPKEGKIRFIALNSPSQERTLALTEVTGVELPKKSNTRMASSCMVMRVNDFASVMEKIKALKLKITELQVVENEKSIVKEQAFYDFDGHLVDLYSIKNKKQ